MQPAQASAPGKIILLGEHAVVHGQPAIAVPLAAVQAMARAEPALPGSGLTVRAPDVGETLQVGLGDGRTDPLFNALGYPLQVALRALELSAPDLTLTVQSTIPMASGLGSGAALATALIRALCAALGRPLSDGELNPLIFEVEKRHHGTPSGIDNTVIVYRQPVYFVRGGPVEMFTVARPFTLLVADTGRSSPTHLAVTDVRRLYEAKPERIGSLFERVGDLVRRARRAIEAGEVSHLGPLMDENQALLRDLTVSSGELDRLCAAAREAGAQGAKLSGGGRGGNMIALVDAGRAEAVSAALCQAGAVNVIHAVVQSP